MIDLGGDSLLDGVMESMLVLTPLALENAALAAALGTQALTTENHHDGVKTFQFGDKRLSLAVGGHGKVQFALTTQLLIQKHRPDLVICAGAAGALHHELNGGDVIVADITVEHDFNLRFAARPLPTFAADTFTLETLKRRAQSAPFRIYFGTLASGDEDVLEPRRAKEIREKTDALAVAWEGAGGARACRMHGVPFVEIRAVTDAADPAAAHIFAQHLKGAMENVAQVLQLLL
jgi:adenosylhomocysteine nucleosidase